MIQPRAVQRIRLVGTSIVGVLALILILRSWACTPRFLAADSDRHLARTPGDVGLPGGIPQYSVVTADSAGALADKISVGSASAWSAKALGQNEAVLLAADLPVFLRSFLDKRFEPYARLMRERGADLGATAGPYAAWQLKYEEYKDVAPSIRLRPVEEQIKYLWEHPELRGVEIVRVADDLVTFGTSPDYGPEWAIGLYGKYSVFSLAGHENLPQAWGNRELPSAWVQIPVEFSNGDRALLRWDFCFIKDRSAWMPVFISVTPCPHRVCPLL